MKKIITNSLMMIALLLLFPLTISGINTTDTRMMSQPAISGNHIAFIYAEDLWVANQTDRNREG